MKPSLLLVSAALALLSSPVQADLGYSGLYVFGDSLVDTGNAQIAAPSYSLPDPAPSALGYFDGRFTDGFNFADDLSLALFGTPSTPALALTGGTNFGVGGATAAPNFNPIPIPPGFNNELQVFASMGQPIANDALVVVTLGSNDVRSVVTDTGVVDFTPTIAGMEGGLAALIGAGARHIVVTGLPDIGQLPATTAFGNPLYDTLATQRSIALNSVFQTFSASLSAATPATVSYFDFFGLEQNLIADPGSFGLPALNTTSSCQSAGPAAVLSGCPGFLYFDEVHPTAHIHQVIADALLGSLAPVPEPQSWTLMIAGLALAGWVMRRHAGEEAVAAVR